MSLTINEISETPSQGDTGLQGIPAQGKRGGPKTSKFYQALLITALQSKTTLSREQLMIGYRDLTTTSICQTKLTTSLSHMRRKGWVLGTWNKISANLRHPYVKQISLELTKQGEQAALQMKGETKEQASAWLSIKGRISQQDDVTSAQPDEDLEPLNGSTCSNCANTVSENSAGYASYWDGLPFCSNRCKREFRICLEEA